MRHRCWRKPFGAALLVLCVSLLGYCASATVRSLSRRARARAAGLSGKGAVVHGRRLFRLGAYELDVSFTPDGRLRCVGLSTPAR